jgi:hypothetical protein
MQSQTAARPAATSTLRNLCQKILWHRTRNAHGRLFCPPSAQPQQHTRRQIGASCVHLQHSSQPDSQPASTARQPASTATERLQHGYSTATAWLQHGYSTATEQPQNSHSTATAWLQHGYSMATAWLQHGYRQPQNQTATTKPLADGLPGFQGTGRHNGTQ